MDFKNSYVVFAGEVLSSAIAAIGFYGDHVRIGFGSSGGWVPFGPERLVARARGNILSELDGHSALDLYKRYPGNGVGRKEVLKQLTEEETENVEESYRKKPVMTGFYSYGEIAPFRPGERVMLHDQTMTITTISED